MSETDTLPREAPASDLDLFGDEVLADPFPHYRALRDMGSAVHLTCSGAWFIGRYADVRKALSDWETFSSAQGIGFNAIINEAWDEALICQDPPEHTQRRKIMNEVLAPPALKSVADTIDKRANALAEKLADMGSFDAVSDFAHDLPIGVVMDLIGWPEHVRPKLLELAEGSWNAAGPENARMQSGLAQLGEMMGLIAEIYDANDVIEGGFAAQLIGASHEGRITRDTAIGMLAGYIVAAFETTISAMASGVWLFAQNPEEWEKLRADPDLAVRAANEIVRMESPIQNFGRVTTREVTMDDGAIIPKHARVVVSYASANRDERQFADPDGFRIDRRERQNLGFGHGPHGCAGQNLARMEMVAVFGALARCIGGFEITGEPDRAINNISRGFRCLPARCLPA